MSIIISPQAGMCNRFRAITSAIALSLITQKKVYHYWVPSVPNSSFPHVRDLQAISLESLFEKSLPRCPDNLIPDICFSEWLPGEYWYDTQSSAQKALNMKNIVKLVADDADDILEYIFNNPLENVLIETGHFLKLSKIDNKIWVKMMRNIYSTFVPKKEYLDILTNIPEIESGIAIRCIDFVKYFPEAYQSFDDILEWIENFDEFALFSDSNDIKDKIKNTILTNNNNKKIYDNIIIQNINNSLKSWEQAFVEFLFLAYKCKNIYGTPKSSFAYEAAMFGNKIYNKILGSINSNSNVSIEKAYYGINNKCVDVTEKLNNMSKKQEYITVSNDIFEDAFPFKKKFLNVEYIDNTSRAVMENDRFYFNPIDSKKSITNFGFVILRCIRTKQHDQYWKECYKCIRKYYDDKIVIIDDNSDQSLISDMPTINTEIIISEFPGRGELLPYYYLYKLKLFDRAVILHDSMFIQKNIDFASYQKIKFLWHFDYHNSDDANLEIPYMSSLDNSNELIEFYKTKQWFGCFGATTVIDYEIICLLQEKYNFFKLLDHIQTRRDRISYERILASIIFFEKILDFNNCSIYGEIFHHINMGYLTFNEYLNMNTSMIPIVKVWTGR